MDSSNRRLLIHQGAQYWGEPVYEAGKLYQWRLVEAQSGVPIGPLLVWPNSVVPGEPVPERQSPAMTVLHPRLVLTIP